MEIKSAEFMKGVIGSEGLPERERPTVGFFGRSNVGKSSVINALAKRKDLARSSSRPGRTTEINYFLVNNEWYLADLPGYGYAKLPLVKREKLRKHVLWFAGTPEDVRLDLAVLVIDAGVGMTASDTEAYGILRDAGRSVVILANKSDKGRRNDITNSIRTLRENAPDAEIIRYSAKTGEGRAELLKVVSAHVGFKR
ncbi:MAG: ribosome biogenesis GTP-binding protein YihA/YsxC [Candidatus Moraniibacteriota bacterium]